MQISLNISATVSCEVNVPTAEVVNDISVLPLDLRINKCDRIVELWSAPAELSGLGDRVFL